MIDPYFCGVEPGPERLPVKYIDVKGREEHEALLRDPNKMEELGLDRSYEIFVYLKRWGGWLDNSDK